MAFDEVHKVKRTGGSRAKVALAVATCAEYFVALTGTPIPNSYEDLYNLLHFLWLDDYDWFFGLSKRPLKSGSPTDVEKINRTIAPFICTNAGRVAAGTHYAEKDYLLFVNDLQGKGLSEETSLAEFVGLCSAACNRPVKSALAIPGVLRLSGSMDPVRGLEDIMRVAKNAGAKKILLPFSCIRDLQNVSMELITGLSPEFYADGDAVDAARKALDL